MTENSFMFYKNFIDAVPIQYQKDFCYALMRFAFFDELPEDEILKAFVQLVSPSIHKKAGAPFGNSNAKKQSENNPETIKKQLKTIPETIKNNLENNPFKTKTETKTENEINNTFSNEKDIIFSKENTKRKVARLKKPTIEEIATYCQQRNNGIDAEQFFAYYESKGWKIGKTPMKDWKSAVITWEKHRQKNTFSRPTNSLTDEDDGRMSPEQEEAFWNAWNAEAEKIAAMQQQKEGKQ